jgi:hypothetical protein
MRRKKKTTIVTVESHERLTIRRSGRAPIRWCPDCGTEACMLTPIEAAALARSDVRSIFRQIELGELHFLENEGESLLICSNSLINQ